MCLILPSLDFILVLVIEVKWKFALNFLTYFAIFTLTMTIYHSDIEAILSVICRSCYVGRN